MKIFKASIPIGIGDLLYIKAMFEPVKHEFSAIHINPYIELIKAHQKDSSNLAFINELSKLLFSEPPYILSSENYPFMSIEQISKTYNLKLQKPNLSSLLCKGTSLNVEDEYIVINTKVRYLDKHLLQEQLPDFWELLNQLALKYKVVILGEKTIENNAEYNHHNRNNICIFSLYSQIIEKVNNQLIIDLTVPALGITCPNLDKLQQDCLIMNEAKFVIQFGVGGSFCIASSVANIIAYRKDDEYSIEQVFQESHTNSLVTKNWNIFISTLRSFL